MSSGAHCDVIGDWLVFKRTGGGIHVKASFNMAVPGFSPDGDLAMEY